MSLDEKTLERLLIDRALGGLSGDVGALLDEYLRDTPRAQTLADEIADTVHVAKKSLAKPRELEVFQPLSRPPTPRRRAYVLPHRWKLFQQAMVLGVGVLLGLGVGNRQYRSDCEPTARLLTQSFDSPQPQPRCEPTEIWSVERFLQRPNRSALGSRADYYLDLSDMKVKRKESAI